MVYNIIIEFLPNFKFPRIFYAILTIFFLWPRVLFQSVLLSH